MSQIESQIEECDRRNYFILNLFCFTLNSLDRGEKRDRILLLSIILQGYLEDWIEQT
ncbi:hypothetical protein [Spirulina sp. 06S082]|uniref:hypothetical protein n=1 Tax=Spirulina sp. 06S082 TaxID=3110248 RepID=UPI002B1FBA00|nr:hypothetical protein [Spirulina sp. 06S082]MEA5468072.1 hypothetical protein [Spirulina sp. 06S082]